MRTHLSIPDELYYCHKMRSKVNFIGMLRDGEWCCSHTVTQFTKCDGVFSCHVITDCHVIADWTKIPPLTAVELLDYTVVETCGEILCWKRRTLPYLESISSVNRATLLQSLRGISRPVYSDMDTMITWQSTNTLEAIGSQMTITPLLTVDLSVSC